MSKIVKFMTLGALLANLFLFCCNQVAADSFNQGLESTGQSMGYNVEENGSKNLWQKIGKILLVSTIFLGVIFLVLMLYAGFVYMTARGNEQEVETAKNIIIYAVIGLVVVLSAYAITNLFYDLWVKTKAQ